MEDNWKVDVEVLEVRYLQRDELGKNITLGSLWKSELQIHEIPTLDLYRFDTLVWNIIDR